MAHQTARLPDENDLTPVEKDPSRTPVPNQSAPHAGRTGGAGARAERPSEGSARKSTSNGTPPGRGGKAPSASDTRDAGEQKAGSGDETKKRGNLPQPARDSTG